MVKRGLALVFVVTLGIQVTACGSGEEETSAHTAAIGDECKTDAECIQGAYCSKGGLSIGLCTADCDNECETRYGDGHICLPEGCFKLCDGPQDCEHGRCTGGELRWPVCAGGPIQYLDQCGAQTVCADGMGCTFTQGMNLCVELCTTDFDCMPGWSCLGGYCL